MSQPFLTGIFKKSLHMFFNAVKFAVLRANYYAGNYKNVVWLLGDGRSGTTFVANLIDWNRQYRELFEPFHPVYVKQMAGISFHNYIRPTDTNHPFTQIASEVFTGRISNSFIDIANKRLIYHDLLIKDIFANLFAYWAYQNFSHLNIKVILLLRNPFAVALSKYKKKHWHWMTDPRDFLKQKDLVDDFLHPYMNIIKDIGDDYIERQIMIWSIINLIPIRQFNKDQFYVLFYEDLISHPYEELSRLFEYINPTFDSVAVDRAVQKLAIPSWVAGSNSNIAQGKSPIDSWIEEITPQQLQSGKKILQSFGLNNLYEDNGLPNRSALNSFLKNKQN